MANLFMWIVEIKLRPTWLLKTTPGSGERPRLKKIRQSVKGTPDALIQPLLTLKSTTHARVHTHTNSVKGTPHLIPAHT